MSKSSTFKSPLRPSAATASVPDTSRETVSEMEISMASDVTHQQLTTSPSHQPAAFATTTKIQFRSVSADEVYDFQFFGACQDPNPSPR